MNGEKKVFTPRNLVFAFDLHKVIFFRSWRALFKHFLNSNRWKFLRFVLGFRFLFNLIKISFRTSVIDEIYEQLILKYPEFSVFEKDFIEIENLQKPNLAVIDLLKKIRGRGFSVYLLSNVGLRAFNELKEKFPDVFKLFNGFYHPLKERSYIQKPDFRFYEGFLDYIAICGDGGKRVFFIDDRRKNLKSAEAMGFECFLFRSSRSLQRKLKNFI